MTDPAIVTAHQRLELAKQDVAVLEKAAEEERRSGIITQLVELRSQRAQAIDTHAELQGSIQPQRDALWSAQRKVTAALEQIRESEKARPACADYLPDDPEVVRWRKAHTALQRKLDQLITARDALPDPDKTATEANQYRGPYGIIAQLEYAEQNLLHALEGGAPRVRFVGSVTGVS